MTEEKDEFAPDELPVPPPTKEAPPRPEESTEEAVTAPTEAEVAPAEVEKAQKPRKKWGSILFDTLLVALLLSVLGGGAWYLHRQMQQYRIPNPLELAALEHLELCRQQEALRDAAYHADEQLHMRKKLAHLEMQIAEQRGKIDEKQQQISRQKSRILALQHEIRQEDKASRSVAKNLLIGLPIGEATTTRGQVYHNAVIYRLQDGYITLRTPSGQARIPLRELRKRNLPDMARYAFGLDDMVDMSDFENASGKPLRHKTRKGKLIPPRTNTTAEPNYEPEQGSPIVETNAAENSTLLPNEESTQSPPAENWQAPAGELPL
ncbi:MAG: hypothetical protein IKK45_07530 [Akkermansia sp.]|nr:hypothetical protein [Akkermansia sp.]